jgi:hypothetical protein
MIYTAESSGICFAVKLNPDCAQKIKKGVYSCFQCTMPQSFSEVNSELKERQ